MQNPVYVLDTNVLIDYPDIIPNGDNSSPAEPSIDFTGANLVIPTTVIRELSAHKKETNDRGYACRKVLKRLRAITDSAENPSIMSVYAMDAKIPVLGGKFYISILPVGRYERNIGPFYPSDEDMDGQIILTSILAQKYSADSSDSIDPNAPHSDYHKADVTLLTNDNALAIRAHARGVRTARFTYRLPPVYTGRRDLTVPPEMFAEFFASRNLSRASFEAYLPAEPPLVANEFIIMYPKDDIYPLGYDRYSDDARFEYIGRYDASLELIVPLRYARSAPFELKNPGQAIYAESLLDPQFSAIVCTGPAGTGKTYMATTYALEATRAGEYLGITVVPCQIDTSMGALPGGLSDKFDPHIQPIKNALRNYFIQNDPEIRRAIKKIRRFGQSPDRPEEKPHQNCSGKSRRHGSRSSRNSSEKSTPPPEEESAPTEKEVAPRSLKQRLDDKVNLIYANWFGDPVPIDFARGRDFSYEIALFDEFQDQNHSRAEMLITRLSTDGNIIITGDINQIHAPYLDKDNNGLNHARNGLKGFLAVAQCTFLPGEIIRHSLVRDYIVRRAESDPGFDIYDREATTP